MKEQIKRISRSKYGFHKLKVGESLTIKDGDYKAIRDRLRAWGKNYPLTLWAINEGIENVTVKRLKDKQL